MRMIYVVGVDGSEGSHRALDFAKTQAKLMSKDVDLILVCVVEWSPYQFQTSEENENRKRRKIEEVEFANKRVIAPLMEMLRKEGLQAEAFVAHGNFVDVLNEIAEQKNASQIFISKFSAKKRRQRMFGDATAQIIINTNIPVTIVN